MEKWSSKRQNNLCYLMELNKSQGQLETAIKFKQRSGS